MKQRISEWVVEKQTGVGKRTRRSQFAELQVLRGDVIFLGDSITEGGLWHEWFPGVPVRNRGIGGDTTRELLARMESATTDSAAAVFLMIGTNDLTLSVPDHAIEDNVTQILRGLRAISPTTPVFLQSIMPRQRRWAERIAGLNRRLEQVADREGAKWIDLWPALSDGAGAIDSRYSLDQIHLTGAGYARWIAVLRPYVESISPL